MSQLKRQVDAEDHVQGGDDQAPVTLVEYGDYECPHCVRAYSVVKAAQAALGADLRFVFRNFPLGEMHRHAENAAEAAEIAAKSGKFWEMHDLLFENHHDLDDNHLAAYAGQLGLDTEAFSSELTAHTQAAKIRLDFMSGLTSGVNGTPTFFINGNRYDGPWDHGTLLGELKELL